VGKRKHSSWLTYRRPIVIRCMETQEQKISMWGVGHGDSRWRAVLDCQDFQRMGPCVVPFTWLGDRGHVSFCLVTNWLVITLISPNLWPWRMTTPSPREPITFLFQFPHSRRHGSCFLSFKFPSGPYLPSLSLWARWHRLKQSVINLRFGYCWTRCSSISHGSRWEWKLHAVEIVEIGVYLVEAGVGKDQKTGMIWYKFICRDVLPNSSVLCT